MAGTAILREWKNQGTTVAVAAMPDLPRDLPFYAFSSTSLGLFFVVFSQLLSFIWFMRYRFTHIPAKYREFFTTVFCTPAFIAFYYLQLARLFDEQSFFEKEGELHISLRFYLKISDVVLFTALIELLSSYQDTLTASMTEILDPRLEYFPVSPSIARRKRFLDKTLLIITTLIAGVCASLQFDLLSRERGLAGNWFWDIERVAFCLDQLHDLVLFPTLTLDILITAFKLKSWLKRDDTVPNTQIDTVIYKLGPPLLSFAIYRSLFTWFILPHWNSDFPTYQAVVGVIICGTHHILIVRFLNRIARRVYRAVNTETPFVTSNGEVPV
ncbi:hypothetical protein BDN72DRAFT_278383 [Pluteus cervinus]|uniref:Uncharacterized protein n=1 Tax=Pluteus cervinus TaxID=181527 RepID=A0ACD3AEU3_9AGAR|nr:hypothetical protein BDN72DRAFT_278383 [Pluteus cervinus]